MDPLAALSPLAQFGIVGFVFIVAMLAFARGWIFSGKAVDKMVDGYVKVIEGKNEVIVDLKAAVAASERRNDMLSLQVSQLVELGKTSNAVLRALPDRTEVAS